MHNLCRWDHNFCDIFRENKKPFIASFNCNQAGWVDKYV